MSFTLKGGKTLAKVILSIDQGTTNTKAILVDSRGNILTRVSSPVHVHYPQPAWVEQDPYEIWNSTLQVMGSCLQNHQATDVAAIAITNQRESVVVWERATGRPVGPSVTWQCRRSAPLCASLAAQNLGDDIHTRSGLQLDPGFTAGKINWLLNATPNGYARAASGELCAGTIDSWLLWNLTGGKVHACDVTNASRTQLFNIHTLQWDATLLDYFGVPEAVMPKVYPSSHIYGHTVTDGTLPGNIAVASMIGDSHAALYGHAGFMSGSVKATYGTGSSLMTAIETPTISAYGISTTVAWGRNTSTTYALEGNISVTGAGVQWFGELLGFSQSGPETEHLAKTVKDNGGVYFVPAFVGLGAPHWDADARGMISGLTRGSTAGHLARATLESIAYQVRDVFDVIQLETPAPLQVLLADGGASANDTLMQFQADMLGCPVLRSASSDVSALGAAYLAGLEVGIWAAEDDILRLPRKQDRFDPQMPEEQRKNLYHDWQEAVIRAMLKPNP